CLPPWRRQDKSSWGNSKGLGAGGSTSLRPFRGRGENKVLSGSFSLNPDGKDHHMPVHPEDFTALMQRVRSGSQDAAQQLVEQYGQHILRVIRRMLHKKLRSKFDSLDFQQDVWASFFADQPQKTFDRPEALAAFLAKVARNKVLM